MKKILLVLLCLLIMLSGCRTSSSQSEQTDPTATETPTIETQPAPSHLPLLEQGIVLELSENLLYIPNATVESMLAPEVRLLGNGLLLSECIENTLVLNHISLENGTLMKSWQIRLSGSKSCTSRLH